MFDRCMVAETEVSILPIVPAASRDRFSQHPIIPEGSDLKNLLGHLGERLGYVGEVPDLLKTIRLLPMLQYQTQFNQMRNAGYLQTLNTALV